MKSRRTANRDEPVTLHQRLTETYRPSLEIRDLPPHIRENLHPRFQLRPYQAEAVQRFLHWWGQPQRRQPTQLLFHMATGSGKTLIMAALILDLFLQGYRNFLFFVNSLNIINKTRDNFLTPRAMKYLFAPDIFIDRKRVRIREVANFQAAIPEDINIIFSTIQGLHTRLNDPRENAVTFDDFENNKIVLISDEAHHLNTLTRRRSRMSKREQEEARSWELTVDRIFRAHAENVLLEFTATADLGHPDIRTKYADKLIYDYSLKQFRLDGYSKEVHVLQSTLPPWPRALQALVLSEYRKNLFARQNLAIKPVILFKSRTIAASREFYATFQQRLKQLCADDLRTLWAGRKSAALVKAFKFFEKHDISLENLALVLRAEFDVQHCLAVNSQEESEEKQIAVNTLEDPQNPVRAVFAVDKLNEGWDVLNLFDIVRLYDTKVPAGGVSRKTSIAEAQLIGRGARYCPFSLGDGLPPDQRKFDQQRENPLRACETLYYHSATNPPYIRDLHSALQEIGLQPRRVVERTLRLKREFVQSRFWREGALYLNRRELVPAGPDDGLPQHLRRRLWRCTLDNGHERDVALLDEQGLERKKAGARHFKGAGQVTSPGERESTPSPAYSFELNLCDLGTPVLRKAMNRLKFYHFSKLKKYFPALRSVSEFMVAEKYLGGIRVRLTAEKRHAADLDPEKKLYAAIVILEELAREIEKAGKRYRGTRTFRPVRISTIYKEEQNIVYSSDADPEAGVGMRETRNTALQLDLREKTWFPFEEFFGPAAEKQWIVSMTPLLDALVRKGAEIYLLPNAGNFRLWAFEDGSEVVPEFVMYMKDSQNSGQRQGN